jgi:hypothetical protein
MMEQYRIRTLVHLHISYMYKKHMKLAVNEGKQGKGQSRYKSFNQRATGFSTMLQC